MLLVFNGGIGKRSTGSWFHLLPATATPVTSVVLTIAGTIASAMAMEVHMLTCDHGPLSNGLGHPHTPNTWGFLPYGNIGTHTYTTAINVCTMLDNGDIAIPALQMTL